MEEAIITRIASQIRAHRLSRNLTLQELSDKVNVSKGLISKLENGRTICSLPVLLNIIAAFDISLAEFFGGVDIGEENKFRLIKKADYRRIEKEKDQNGFEYLGIINKIVGNIPIEIVFLTIHPGVKRKPVQTDALEFKYIISGVINYHFNDDIVVLEKGDSLYFDGRIPHFPYNAGSDPVEMLVLYFYY